MGRVAGLGAGRQGHEVDCELGEKMLHKCNCSLGILVCERKDGKQNAILILHTEDVDN